MTSLKMATNGRERILTLTRDQAKDLQYLLRSVDMDEILDQTAHEIYAQNTIEDVKTKIRDHVKVIQLCQVLINALN